MNVNDFVFDQVYKALLKAKVKEREAHNAALNAVAEYKKGRFKTPSLLIMESIKAAKKIST